jgi:hypothetical protein
MPEASARIGEPGESAFSAHEAFRFRTLSRIPPDFARRVRSRPTPPAGMICRAQMSRTVSRGETCLSFRARGRVHGGSAFPAGTRIQNNDEVGKLCRVRQGTVCLVPPERGHLCPSPAAKCPVWLGILLRGAGGIWQPICFLFQGT